MVEYERKRTILLHYFLDDGTFFHYSISFHVALFVAFISNAFADFLFYILSLTTYCYVRAFLLCLADGVFGRLHTILCLPIRSDFIVGCLKLILVPSVLTFGFFVHMVRDCDDMRDFWNQFISMDNQIGLKSSILVLKIGLNGT